MTLQLNAIAARSAGTTAPVWKIFAPLSTLQQAIGGKKSYWLGPRKGEIEYRDIGVWLLVD